jgi:2-hydroxychromene-2-carboxylate isomerase
MADAPTFEFFFDVASPYTYLAATRIDAAAADAGVTAIWRPFLLGAVLKATGNAPPALVPARGRYMFKDLQRWSKRLDIPLVLPSMFPTNTLTAQRILAASPDPQSLRTTAHALFQAYWADGRDIGDRSVLSDVLGQDLVDVAATDAAKDALRAHTTDAIERGAFGAPTFYVGDQMYFGNDRLDWALEAARTA